jgi:mono/diheme cytochrome c family protein
MLKLLFVLPAALLFAFLPQEPTATPNHPDPAADTATPPNPVQSTPESRAHAKTVYGMDCAICHGASGNGKGELVADMQLKMKDFTDPSVLKDKSDAELFSTIKNGNDLLKMPAEGPRAKDADIWNLVVLVRSFAKK